MRKALVLTCTVAYVLVFALLTSVSALTMAPGLTHKILIKSDGSVEPADAPIERSGSVYSLTGDINFTSIKVSCNGIVLDGKGFFDRGYEGYDKAVILDNTISCVVRNFNFLKFSSQISIEGGTGNMVYGNTFTGAYYGVEIYSNNCQIYQNKFVSTKPGDCYGIEGECQNTVISNNIFTNFGASIQLTHSENNTITSNSFADATSIMFYRQCNNNTITKNTITGVGLSGTGIYLLGSNHNLICENEISDKAKNYQPSFDNCFGVWIYESSDNIVKCNNITGNLVGIQIGHNFYPEDPPSINNYFALNNIYNNVAGGANVGLTKYDTYPVNFWDNGTYGNYWSEYAKRYSGSSGIDDLGLGTTPYNITVNNVDQHPLLAIIGANKQAPTPTSDQTAYDTDSPTLPEDSGSSSNQRSICDYVAIGSASVAAAGLIVIAVYRKKIL
ncbi:MAG: right-handed parallel beta-helix repeat-containing protein [Candidatus Bathyarchaeota archaeon]|nr:right-handed parallel beta-helix repeat-containing protein [Candidatus Bathyarchaeota archaeon]